MNIHRPESSAGRLSLSRRRCETLIIDEARSVTVTALGRDWVNVDIQRLGQEQHHDILRLNAGDSRLIQTTGGRMAEIRLKGIVAGQAKLLIIADRSIPIRRAELPPLPTTGTAGTAA